MPSISLFYGIVVYMYYKDFEKHHLPHIHVKYQEYTATISITDGEILSGKLPNKQLKMVQVWIDIHQEDLLLNWDLAVAGETPYRIEPLR